MNTSKLQGKRAFITGATLDIIGGTYFAERGVMNRLHRSRLCPLSAVNLVSLHLVQKLWNYRNILRDDGLSCGAFTGKLLTADNADFTDRK